MPVVIGQITHHPSRPERLALILADGTVNSWFGQDDTIATVRAMLAPKGYSVADDGVVTRV
jgi:hypothetical protein